MKITVISVAAAALIAAGATSASAGSGYWVSEFGITAKMQTRYDYAYCHGLRRYGTQSLNTTQWGWVPGYFEFQCSYDIGAKSCYNGRFETDAGKGQSWYVRMLSPGSCYPR